MSGFSVIVESSGGHWTLGTTVCHKAEMIFNVLTFFPLMKHEYWSKCVLE